jgi:hypothetical protein
LTDTHLPLRLKNKSAQNKSPDIFCRGSVGVLEFLLYVSESSDRRGRYCGPIAERKVRAEERTHANSVYLIPAIRQELPLKFVYSVHLRLQTAASHLVWVIRRNKVPKGATPHMNRIKFAASLLSLSVALTLPVAIHAQESHEDAVAQTRAHDHRHHTKAKFVGTGAVGGALIGAKVGGPVSALVGAGAGAGAGLVANHAHRHHEIRKREEYGTPRQ